MQLIAMMLLSALIVLSFLASSPIESRAVHRGLAREKNTGFKHPEVSSDRVANFCAKLLARAFAVLISMVERR